MALKPDEAAIIPLVVAPVGLPSLIPNTDGWVGCAAIVFEAGGLLNRFVAGCTFGADGFVEMPKLNIGFSGGSDGVEAARGLDGVTLVGLLVIPKLNFGLDASLVPPPGIALALGLVIFSVDVGGLGFCASENIPRGELLEPIPFGADEVFKVGLFDGTFVCPKEKIEEAAEPLVSGAGDGAVVGCEVFVKKVGVVELDETGPLAVEIDAEVCVTGVGAEGKGNKGPGATVAVLASGLTFASLDWVLRDGVGILNKGGGLEGSLTCGSRFGSAGIENEDAPVGGAVAIEGFSSGFGSETADNVDAAAAFFASASFAFASASAFAFSFSSALRRRRAIASASISCFSHFE